MNLRDVINQLRHGLKQALDSEHVCLTCAAKESELEDGLFRCWDCKSHLCGRCAKGHFANNHQPHPITVTQIRTTIRRLADALLARCKDDATDGELAALFRADETMRRLFPEKGEPKFEAHP